MGEYPHTLNTVYSMANTLKACVDASSAKALFLRCATGYEMHFGPDYEWARKAWPAVDELAASLATPAAARQQLEGKAAVSVRGVRSSMGDFDGEYRLAGEHEGWPRFESAAGNHLYRIVAKGMWCLHDEFDPEMVANFCVTSDGALPEGAAMWECWVDGGFAQVEVTPAVQ